MNLFPRPLNIVSESEPASPPEVSVIVTLYNYGRFIEDCLDSIAAQTQGNMELVVVDDFSTDDGLMRVLKWLETNARKFTGFRVVAHLENMGLSYARNTAFGLARAPRVFVMDADNMIYPRAIERCMQAMDASGSAGAYTQLEIFGDRTGVGEADFWDRERFKPRNYVDAMALVAKSAWEKVGGYSQLGANGWEDYDFWCKFVEHGLECTFVPEMLCRYRVHGTSMLHTETNPNAGLLILEMAIRHPWLEHS